MAWSTSDRRSRLPRDWQQLRAKRLKYDRFECQWRMSDKTRCGEPATDVDHVEAGDDHSFGNLQSLCEWHHRKKSSGEGAAASHANRGQIKNRYKRVEDHPGLL